VLTKAASLLRGKPPNEVLGNQLKLLKKLDAYFAFGSVSLSTSWGFTFSVAFDSTVTW
jgi:hypothetical protein